MATTTRTYYFLRNDSGRNLSIGFVDQDNNKIESGKTFYLNVKVLPESMNVEDLFDIIDLPESVSMKLIKKIAFEMMLTGDLEEKDVAKISIFEKQSRGLDQDLSNIKRRSSESYYSQPDLSH